MAIFARIIRQAFALEGIAFISTESTIHTWIASTFVDFNRTIFSTESRWTGTDEIVDRIMAGPSVSARVNSTFVDIYLAMGSVKSR